MPGDAVSLYLGATQIPFPYYLTGGVLGTALGVVLSTILGSNITEPGSPAFWLSATCFSVTYSAKQVSKDSIAYEEPQGFSGLRHILVGYLYLSRGVKCSAEQIIFTSGHQQSMNIIANLFNNARSASMHTGHAKPTMFF